VVQHPKSFHFFNWCGEDCLRGLPVFFFSSFFSLVNSAKHSLKLTWSKLTPQFCCCLLCSSMNGFLQAKSVYTHAKERLERTIAVKLISYAIMNKRPFQYRYQLSPLMFPFLFSAVARFSWTWIITWLLKFKWFWPFLSQVRPSKLHHPS